MQGRKQAVRISREVSNQIEELIGGAHHEINNLSFLIGTSAELMPMLDNPQKKEEMLETIEKKVVEINKTLMDLRAVVKDASKDEPEDTKVNDLAETVVHLCKRRFNNHHVILKTKLDKDFVLHNRKNQVIQSLLSLLNSSHDAVASKSDESNRWIELIVREKRKKLEIIIKDSAPLLTEEEVSQLFETESNVQDRKGLCLAIVKENIQENGGMVKYRQVDGHNAIVIGFNEYQLSNAGEAVEEAPQKQTKLAPILKIG